MFFLDSTGFFSLICLFVQCGMAWIFAAFFAVMSPSHGPWLRRWFRAFVGLGVAFAALSVRFFMAHHAVAGEARLHEGDLVVRLLYGLYLVGKVMFAWCLLGGLAAMRGRSWQSHRWFVVVFAVAFVVGAALPTIESVLLFQAVWMPYVMWRAAWLSRTRPEEGREIGRTVLRGACAVWGALWLLYAVSVLVVGPVPTATENFFGYVLRLNSLFDLGLQVVVATSLIVVVMSDSERAKLDALRERDRLREQVQRDEKLLALSTLVGGVAHEFNNPLTAMLGHVDDLEALEPVVRQRAIAIVRQQIDRCRVIVQRMSLLGRGASLAVGEVDVDDVLKSTAAQFTARFQTSGVTLQLDVPPLLSVLHADPTGFAQVIVNLFGNALHASPRGGTVRVTVQERSHGVSIEVQDQGKGVPVGDRSRIFEPFWTTRAQGEGLGLGLAVVDAIVRAHSGRVEVEDAPGGGARFRLLWPWRPLRATAAELPAGAAVGTPGRARLLVIDDEPLVRAMISRQASAEGYEVVEAESGARALELLLAKGAEFAAIICDLRMPGTSGAALHDQLERQAPQWLSRLLFVTGDLASNEAAAFAERCRAPILTKPFSAIELMRRVRAVQNVG